MNKNQNIIRIIIITFTIIFTLSSKLYFFWIRKGGGALFFSGIIELISFLTVIVSLIIIIVRIIKFDNWRNIINYITIIFAVFVYFIQDIEPLRVDENTNRSNVQIRACYEGTMNTSRLFLREDGTFEDYNIGWFAFVRYTNGNWTKNNDTLFLEFKKEIPRNLDTIIVIKNNYLYKISSDTLVPTHYYLGHCKGLN